MSQIPLAPDPSTSQGVVEYHENKFSNVEDIIEYAKSFPKEERYSVQYDLLERLIELHTTFSDGVETMYQYIARDRAYILHTSEDVFKETWLEALKIIEANKERRDRTREATANITQQWSDGRALEWAEEAAGSRSANWLCCARKLSRKMSFAEAVPRINEAVLQRLKVFRKGGRRQKDIISSDLEAAAAMSSRPEPPSDDLLQQLGLHIDRYGLVREGAAPPMLDFPRRAGEILDADAGTQGEEQSRPATSSSASQPARRPLPTGVTDYLLYAPEDDPVDEETIVEAERAVAEAERLSRKRGGSVITISDDESGVDVAGGSDYEGRSPKRQKVGVGSCGCSPDVERAWKEAVMRKRDLGLTTDLKLLARMVRFERVCYPHTKAMGGHIGLMLKHLNHQQLTDRLRSVHENRLRIGTLKTASDTFTWFRTANRPVRPSDGLGPYKFIPQSLAAVQPFSFDQQAALATVEALEIVESRARGIRDAWTRDGTVNVDVFSWWFDGPIGAVIKGEFAMYRHHLREINGKSNYGWLRNMFYSIGQQLMRQDPVYYLLYAGLRPDKQWRLVTYPYYAKYAKKGDQTYFRHLDLNIPELIANDRGSGMIQGSVSIDDEDDSNCTVIIPGMQHKLAEWWQRCVDRGQKTDGFVHRITEAMFTREDAAALGVDWKRVPCQAGEVRVSLPHLPHGADGPSAGVRRTMLPWFVGVQDDMESLEVIEGGTWSQLSEAHRDMTAPKATPSGLANMYGAIPYRFPAAVEVTGLGAISDALVCRRRWDSVHVLRERSILLGNDLDIKLQYIREWRSIATQAALDAFNAMREAEELAYGPKSYFRLMREHGGVLPEVEPDPDDMADFDPSTDRTVALNFAEEGASIGGGDSTSGTESTGGESDGVTDGGVMSDVEDDDGEGRWEGGSEMDVDG